MSHNGTLYVVATPIGNLQDITLRALETLRTVDLVAAEDTRHTAQLLRHFGIQAKLAALHEHNERAAGQKLVTALQAGQSVALVSDAGTPAIADPGALLVQLAREAGIRVVPVPGANAAVAALSASGMRCPRFLFVGFLPAKSGERRRVLRTLCEVSVTLVFYEAPHRILECIDDMAATFGDTRGITFARELTKAFETIHHCTLGDAADWLREDANRQRGEFVLLVEAASPAVESGVNLDAQRVLQVLLAELPLKQAVKLAAEITGAKKNMLYQYALELKPND